MANQMGMVFSKLDCKPRWRERLPEIEVPTLVVHGRRDPFFPVGNGEAIAREIQGAAARPRGGRHCDPRCGGPARSPRRWSRSGRGRRVPRGYGIRAAVGVGGSTRPRAAPAIGARGTLEGGSEEPRPGRSGRLLHAVKERIEALRWHGNDQHGLLV